MDKIDYTFLAPRMKMMLLLAAILGGAGCVYGFFQDKGQFAFSYLTSFTFFTCLALGGMFFVLVQHLTRAGWSVVVRRTAENVMASLQWMWILSLPVFFCLGDLFHWAHYEHNPFPKDAILDAKSSYLGITFFCVRAAAFFLIWIGVSRFLEKKSVTQDVSGDKQLTRSLQKWSTLGLILYVLTETFFSFDWLMSLQPHWFSTIFGVYYFSCSAVGIFSLLIILSILLQRAGYLKSEITPEHYHDLGKLLFGFNMFWVYIAFSQFLLIWYGNLGEETPFYHLRAQGSWKTLSTAMVYLHFVIPFFFMISRVVKRNRAALFTSAVWLLLVNYLDIYWLVMPNHHPKGIHFSLADFTSFLFVGSMFFYIVLMKMEKRALIPIKDPRLQESLKFKNA